MTQKLFIPKKIKVGFQKREGTYTGKLAYVIYYDSYGKIRKEKSWESWRDSEITPVEFDNIPTEGFVLNKKVGGYKSDWNFRQAYSRVYDPRDFEFEITVENLLFILAECDCSRGKGLEGKFVYAWNGTDLVLLPVTSKDYVDSEKFTELQAKKIKVKELIQGATYATKARDAEQLVYLGKFDHYQIPDYHSYSRKQDKIGYSKRFIFWEPLTKSYHYLTGCTNLGAVVNETPVDNYAYLVQKYYKGVHGSKIVKIYLAPGDPKDTKSIWFRQENNNFYEVHNNYDYTDKSKINYCEDTYAYRILDDGILKCTYNYSYRYDNSNHPGLVFRTYTPHGQEKYNHYYMNNNVWGGFIVGTGQSLFVELESGSKFRVENGQLKAVKKENKNGEEN